MKQYDNVTIFDHVLIRHKIAILRDERTSMKEFRELVEEITTLMTYCAITGKSAVGQTYDFAETTWRTFSQFKSKYYTYNGATTNYPEIFKSESDMKGLQMLIDQYLEEKAYREYQFK